MWPFSDSVPALPQVDPNFTDHIYATKHGVELSLRVWRADPTRPDGTPAGGTEHNPQPWILWAHGGGFTGGTHYVPPVWVLPAFLRSGVHVVSYAYRLAPHASLSDQVEDARDALRWCRDHLACFLGDVVDVDAYAVGGESAGGTLALLNGFLSPRPRAVVDVYGISDFSDAYYEPRIEGCGYDPGVVSGKFSEHEIETAIADRDLTYALLDVPRLTPYGGAEHEHAAVDRFRKRARAPEFEYTPAHALRADVKTHIQATGRMLRVLTRYEAYDEAADWAAAAAAQGPLGRLEAEEGGAAFPPTFFLHGTGDRVVPLVHSTKLAAVLTGLGVDVGEAYEPGQDHGFDDKYTGPDVEGWDTYIAPLVRFVLGHLRRE
ncbi:hypothetical protein Q8F55_007607 [Vanrija albida]|uniref:Alpha/beta hydrolase fold-3 domain-containing protein n=1 Tax=Vanrija albida TaxID=181172 RepID=A0ABR3PU07_9TREE